MDNTSEEVINHLINSAFRSIMHIRLKDDALKHVKIVTVIMKRIEKLLQSKELDTA